ncbi:hypothetical protein NLI96_g1578 [Meripilus lineatus]|uniref:GYF domain-containing protein n=1 Tax=Meripilus lineatus TaxID=2056292 RepID=A0AAD5VFP1_9APHY|nr:hypothetical protein NLI96_g1578 [Physisporinus lineatus]
MPPRPVHKRAAASNGEGSSQHAAKKTRFVEPEDDPANFADNVDSQLENPSAHRKGRVKTEGYESDSSDDGEGVVLSRRAGGADKDGEDEDDDMFNLGDKDETQKDDAGMGGKKKKEEYLMGGIMEGQEFGKRGSGEESDEEESEDEGEPEDEDDAERRKKAGMGYELSSFNMREEMEEGKFAADGTYVRSFDPHAVHDRWMDGVDDKEIKKARKSHKMQAKIEKEKMRAEERELQQLGGKEDIEKEMLRLLKKGETVLEALQRLGAKAKKSAPSKKKPPTRSKTDDTTMAVDKPPPKPASDIDTITHLASLLMSLGETDVYSKTYEELVRSVRSAGKVDRSWVPPSADVKYEYKWDVPGATAEEGQIFGPYSEEEMRSWYKASYFGAAGEKIKIRPVEGEWGDWDDVVS